MREFKSKRLGGACCRVEQKRCDGWQLSSLSIRILAYQDESGTFLPFGSAVSLPFFRCGPPHFEGIRAITTTSRVPRGTTRFPVPDCSYPLVFELLFCIAILLFRSSTSSSSDADTTSPDQPASSSLAIDSPPKPLGHRQALGARLRPAIGQKPAVP